MQIFLDSYGAWLGVENGMFRVKPRNNPAQLFAVRRVNAIFLTRGVSASSDALLLALVEQIPVIFLNPLGQPEGFLWQSRYGSVATIRRQQALFGADVQRWDWVRRQLVRKVSGQRRVLEDFLEQHPDWPAPGRRILNRNIPVLDFVQKQLERWSPAADAEPEKTFRGWEGTASRHYFRALSAALPPAWQFEGRSSRPALDPFNCLLNYCYGILYSLVELALLKAGLDPAIGFFHADRHNRPTLAFDCIEPYRCWAEAAALQLCHDGRLSPDVSAFGPAPEGEGWWLVQPGKGRAVEAFFHFLAEKTPHPPSGVQQRRGIQIDLDAVQLASFIKNREL